MCSSSSAWATAATVSGILAADLGTLSQSGRVPFAEQGRSQVVRLRSQPSRLSVARCGFVGTSVSLTRYLVAALVMGVGEAKRPDFGF